ncbi:histidine--tRNA ligase [Hornefia butyriciproducens]|uniref:Histidine--tRNA ligase n=1 Tax=Hornefia butyriciproducens TaxID=2652293 RepID=A0A6L5Y6M4_9FIRM|nr:histidine--tRNA ligase [Hornefia butyriciproducens]MCI7414026.1 histidine--tRNA ligase [Clostridiales bacterium]MDD6299520.1 histidine--tRNA ligase [Hornefia butyriciproducens]MDD7020210.1 histidine--tRNA ligase [Hornefia butyriciproducens]MDY5424524.1 histidine--tRNA ligase [Hornefia butyriciproducens]MDY5463404.1 histidine--tRNA ligase [Hornefia butyriciproducens]
MLTNAPKGTKDTLPDQVYRWHYVEKKFAEICDRYGYREIRTPVFEHTELINRGVGDTTDIVQKEMYTFNDHGGRSLTLKPEGTSPAVRAFVEHKMYAEVQPTKLYYVTPCFRYEKPQSGRLREFHQFGIEIFGTPNMMADTDVICLAHDFLEEMGIRDVTLEINSVGCPECRARYRKALQDFLRPHYDELCDTCKDRFERNPMRILDCKSPEDQAIVKDAPEMLDYLCDDCAQAFRDVQEDLTAMGIEYVVNPRIVRGLDYYTKTAFEFVSNSIGAQGTVCGGGRYDNLCEELGGPPIPGVGFGLGIERLLMLMDANGVEIPEPSPVEVFIVTMGDKAKAEGLGLIHTLHREGISAQMDTLARNVKGQFKYAARLNARYTIVIGDEEIEKGVVQFKDMEQHEQREIPFGEILKELGK